MQHHFHNEDQEASEHRRRPGTVERVEAVDAAPTETTDPATAEIDIENLDAITRQATRLHIRRILILPAALLVQLILLEMFALFTRTSLNQLLLQPAVFLPFIGVLLTVFLTLTYRSRRDYDFPDLQSAPEATNSLAVGEDVRAVGPLIEALQLGENRSIYLPARRALITRLPRLQASDAERLTANQRGILRLMLSPIGQASHDVVETLFHRGEEHAALQIAILKAFEQMGNARDLPFVERLAKGSGRGQTGRRVKQAAIDCLPYLRERIQLDKPRQTLLRPSSASDAEPDRLLRPAGSGEPAPADQLLRAAEADPGHD